MRTLVTGWFSFADGEGTVGDLRAAEVVCGWLDDAGIGYDVAAAGSFRDEDSVDWRRAAPSDYSHLVFVCGPAHGGRLDALLDRFSSCRRIGVDVSLVPGSRPDFDAVLERDGGEVARPDLAIATPRQTVPLVAVVRAHSQPEYGAELALDQAHAVIDEVLAAQPVATVELDTRVDPLEMGRRTSAQVEAPISRADVVVTTRLHGLVTALKWAVPAVAVDPVRGGGKVSAQAEALGWPYVCGIDDLDAARLSAALRACREPGAARRAADCRDEAAGAVGRLSSEFVATLVGSSPARA